MKNSVYRKQSQRKNRKKTIERIIKMKKKTKVSFSSNANGYVTPRVVFPGKWAKEMGITPEERDAVLTFDGQKITIEKEK